MSELQTLKVQLMDTFLHGKDNISIEQQIADIESTFMCDTVSIVFESLDEHLMPQMKARGFEIERSDERSIQFMFGEVRFRRRLYKRGNRTSYALDERLGLAGYERYSPAVKANMSFLASRLPYGKASEATEILTPLHISPSTIQHMVIKADKAIHTYEHNQHKDGLPIAKQVPVLYVEGDGLQLKLQQSKTQNHKELARFQVHEGSIASSGRRRKCKNMVEFSDFSNTRARQQLDEYLRHEYDLTNTIVISGSDGGSGFAAEAFDDFAPDAKAHEHFIDGYHVHRKLEERMWFCPSDFILKMRKAIYSYSELDRDKMLDAVDYVAEGKGEQEKEDARLLRDYFDRNWPYMKPMSKRGTPVSRHGMGVAESNHRPHAYRMKHQSKSWGLKGGNAMAHIIDAQRNGTLFEALSNTWSLQVSIAQDKEYIPTPKFLKDVHTPHTIGDPNKGWGKTLKGHFNK